MVYKKRRCAWTSADQNPLHTAYNSTGEPRRVPAVYIIYRIQDLKLELFFMPSVPGLLYGTLRVRQSTEFYRQYRYSLSAPVKQHPAARFYVRPYLIN
jgi:hypothetical protein